MAEPKKRTNKSKTGMRRMHHKFTAPSINYCSNCHEPMIRHQVCTFCGFYKGKKILNLEDKKEKIEEKEAPTITPKADVGVPTESVGKS